MLGRRDRDQGKLFYEFKVDDMIPKDHLLRRMDVFVSAVLTDLHAQQALLQRHWPAIGRSGAHDPDATRGLLLWPSLR
jgi:hypothetical protein